MQTATQSPPAQMPNSLRPPASARASKSVTACFLSASRWARGRPGRPRAHDGDAPAGGGGARVGMPAALHERVGREALKPACRHRLSLGRFPHAGLLAERLGRTGARTSRQDVAVADRLRRRTGHARRDPAHDERDIDRGRTGGDAGRVVAEVAAVRGDGRLMTGQRRARSGSRTARRTRSSSARWTSRPGGRCGGTRRPDSPAVSPATGTLRHRSRSTRLPVVVPGLGGRGDPPPAGGHRGGAGAHGPEPGRGRLRPLGPVRAAATHGRLGNLPRRKAPSRGPGAALTPERRWRPGPVGRYDRHE